MPDKQRSGGKPAWSNLALVLLSAGLGLVIIEIGLRLTCRPDIRLVTGRGFLKPDPDADYDQTENFPRQAITSFDGKSRYWQWTNELGCFDNPFQEGPYALLVGDSFTFGGNNLQDTWGGLLEANCGQRILKCGVAGYGTRQELLKAEKIMARAGTPRLIVVGHYVNDIDDDYLVGGGVTVVDGWPVTRKKIIDYQTGKTAVKTEAAIRLELSLRGKYGEIIECPSNTSWQLFKCWLYRNSMIYHRLKLPLRNLLTRIPMVKRVLVQSRALASDYQPLAVELSPDLPWVKKAWKAHLANLKAFQKLAARRHAKLLIVLIPHRDQLYPFLTNTSQTRRDNVNQAHEALRKFLAREGIDHMDLLDSFRQYEAAPPDSACGKDCAAGSAPTLYYKHDIHWSPLGQRLAGLLVARRILEQRLLDSPDRQRRLLAIDQALADWKQPPARP